MIIVKTNNGDRFINEAETLQVNHLRDKAQVEVWPARWGNQQQQPQYYLIEHVIEVMYVDNGRQFYVCRSDKEAIAEPSLKERIEAMQREAIALRDGAK